MPREPAPGSEVLRRARGSADLRPAVEAAATFGQLLRARRHQRGLSLAQLAAMVHFDKGHLSKVETDKRPPSVRFAEACDRVLNSGRTFTDIASALEATVRQQQEPIRPGQLPAPQRNFVGRKRYLDRLDSVLHGDKRSLGVPVVVVNGPPGVGKTAVAVRWAHRAVECGHFRDGQLFVDLQGPEPETAAEPFDVLEDMLQALGVPAAQVPVGLEQRAATFRSLLRGREMLLVLDNAAETRQIHPLLPGSRGCAVVVTGRVRLSGLTSQVGAATFTLPELGRLESTELIRSIIGDARAAADLDAVAILAERCDDFPLALVLAAAHIVNHGHHSAAALAAELKSESAQLDLGEDEATLRSVFDSSYNLLDDRTARMFRLLGALPGLGIDATNAAAIAGIDQKEAARLLRDLAGAHLIRHHGEHRYQFHRLLHVYAAELVKRLHTATELVR